LDEFTCREFHLSAFLHLREASNIEHPNIQISISTSHIKHLTSNNLSTKSQRSCIPNPNRFKTQTLNSVFQHFVLNSSNTFPHQTHLTSDIQLSDHPTSDIPHLSHPQSTSNVPHQTFRIEPIPTSNSSHIGHSIIRSSNIGHPTSKSGALCDILSNPSHITSTWEQPASTFGVGPAREARLWRAKRAVVY
jgi:hypothetical protein